MNAYEFIEHSSLFKDWDGIGKPKRALVQLAFDFLHYGYSSRTPDENTRNELQEMLYLLKNGGDF